MRTSVSSLGLALAILLVLAFPVLAAAPASSPTPTGSNTTSVSVTLTWTKVATATGYTITASPASGTDVTKTVGDVSTTVLGGLEPETTYSITMVASNGDGDASAGTALSVTTSASTSIDEDGIPLPDIAQGLETLAEAGAIRLIGFMLGVSLAFYIYRRIRMR